jgi:large conductance mechanosensitive channel
VLAYGNFLTILLNFIILAFVIFQMVRLMNMRKPSKRGRSGRAPAPRRKTSCCCAKSAIR